MTKTSFNATPLGMLLLTLTDPWAALGSPAFMSALAANYDLEGLWPATDETKSHPVAWAKWQAVLHGFASVNTPTQQYEFYSSQFSVQKQVASKLSTLHDDGPHRLFTTIQTSIDVAKDAIETGEVDARLRAEKLADFLCMWTTSVQVIWNTKNSHQATAISDVQAVCEAFAPHVARLFPNVAFDAAWLGPSSAPPDDTRKRRASGDGRGSNPKRARGEGSP